MTGVAMVFMCGGSPLTLKAHSPDLLIAVIKFLFGDYTPDTLIAAFLEVAPTQIELAHKLIERCSV
jgi:hypothetical protein